MVLFLDIHFFFLFSSIPGYLFDNIEWCGNSTETDGIEKYPSICPGYEVGPDCQKSAQSVFWETASKFVCITSHNLISI